MNGSGEVVGVIASTLSVEYLYREVQHIPQNINFAIKADYLKFLLQQTRDAAPTTLDLEDLARDQQIAAIRPSIGQVRSRVPEDE